MDYNELIERYVYAVVKYLPRKTRDDVSKELRTLIEDMLEARCGLVAPTEKDVHVILAELGTPYELAQNYNSQKEAYLIGPKYFPVFKLVATIVLIVNLCATFLAIMIAIVFKEVGAQTITGIIQMLFDAVGSLFAMFGIIVLIFAGIERKKVNIETKGYDPYNLPPVPKKEEIIKKSEAIAGIVFTSIFFLIFLAAPQVFSIQIFSSELGFFTVFNEEIVRNSWLLLFAIFLTGIGSEIVKLIEGRYTKRLAVICTITNFLSFLLFAFFVNTKGLIDSNFLEVMNQISTQEDINMDFLKLDFRVGFLLVLGIIISIETISIIIKAYKYDKNTN